MAHCLDRNSDQTDNERSGDHSFRDRFSNRQYSNDYSMMPLTLAPAGLKAMYAACRGVYPDQPNPLQVTAIVKYWFGGPDPLDYISMYRNSGDSKRDIPPHWHYISFGLSDLHGDGRVHKISGPHQPSGHGFELTFRLKADHVDSTEPPLWPASLLQSLARYIFSSGNTFCIGDHIPWKSALNGSSSTIQNMIICADPQMESMATEFGTVNFLQVVGVLEEEMEAVRWWNGVGVADLMKSTAQGGGRWLITDMNRNKSIFDINPSLRDKLNDGILNDGSNLSGVTGRCSWKDSKNHFSPAFSTEFQPFINFDLPSGFVEDPKILKTHDSVHVTLELGSVKLLHLAIRGRLKHGRHFTFKSVMNDSAITLVQESVEGSLVTKDEPIVSKGNWLQILLDDNFMEDILEKCLEFKRLRDVDLPHTISWPSRGVIINILGS